MSPSRPNRLIASLALLLFAPALSHAAEAALEIRPGDHVSIIGNTLADRMQHDGWLEAMLQTRFPKDELVVRDLGYSGDELTTRLRSADFGSPNDWLTRTKTDVVLAFFGYNESFGDVAGLNKFKADLDNFVKFTLAQKYNGKTAPRLVLFSPVANEDLHHPHLPDGRENNRRIATYTDAMAEVARANRVPFVDLFHATQELYANENEPLTMNGVHLNHQGNRLVAEAVDRALFPNAVKRDAQVLDKVRQAVLDKNFYWFNRYRTVDGYSIYGGRADLRFVKGQTNREVMQREMEVLDVMTANRDKRIWAAAQGEDLKIEDGNTPPFIPVTTNKPGAGPNGTHLFVDGEEAIKQMSIAKGMKVNLFASEKEFPELAKPVQMSFDTKGRLWVAAWPTYPHWKPKEDMNDKLLVLEDTDGDGRADKLKVFADRLHCPTGFEFWNGGVLLAQAPDLMFLKDTDGDDKADVRERILHGLDSADTHHTANSFRLDPGGALYFQEGTFHHTQVETPYGPPVRCANAGVFRYEPRTQKFEVYVSYPFANPHGHVFDHWGQDFVTDGTGNVNYYATAFSGHVEFPYKHAGMKPFFQQKFRPCPGTEILSSRHFPEELQGAYLDANVIGYQGIYMYKVKDDGSGFLGEEMENMVSSPDPSFRPADLEVGPDGALYFIEWQNPIIGHMQHNLRDPSRDRIHGRVYRVTYEGRPLLKPAKIAGERIEALLELLKEPEDRVRYRTKIELGARPTDRVLEAVNRWVNALDKNDPNYEHHVLEALWVHQHHDVVNVPLLQKVLHSPDYRARAAATKVLCYWRDRIPTALDLLKTLAADPYPRVRLEAVRAASFFTTPEAVEVALITAEHPTDYYLDYTRTETMKTLEPYWKKALAEGREIAFTSDAGAHFLLKGVTTEHLLKMKRSYGVMHELLYRPGIRDEFRREALAALAKGQRKEELRVLLDVMQAQDELRGTQDESVVFDLARLLTERDSAQLAAFRGDLERMAKGSNLAVTRQLAFVALVAADNGVDRAWDLAVKSIKGLVDLLNAMPLIRDPAARASLYPKVEPLLSGLPTDLAASTWLSGPSGRYVRVELPRRGTLTLAEVEVYSDGRNVARRGKATQKNTAFGGDPQRALDGNSSGNYGDGGQSHTEEQTDRPWWEVDLGAEAPIESIVIYNRTDGPYGGRLEGFTLQVLDAERKVVYEAKKLPSPVGKASYAIGQGSAPRDLVRRAAMNALTYVRGQEGPTFKALARFVQDGTDRHAAIQALQRIPAADWPKESVEPLIDSLLAAIRKLPAGERTSPAALDAIQLGDALAATLPLDRAKAVRMELGELGVRVLRLGTVPEQMLFDKERLAVKAGRPFEVWFENNDLMPHNFVVTKPGALEEVGLLGESSATEPGALERGYVPRSDKILAASRLLAPRDSQKLNLQAPGEPGVYPYVCTYPGHWRRMYGSLYVVEDLEAYLANPEAYLSSHPLPIKDELLKFNRPRKAWTFADLASSVEPLEPGRSYANGKQIFQVANCVACHKINDLGTEVGPDLTKPDPKYTVADILREILEPSKKIDDKYATYLFETTEGQVLTGVVLNEGPLAITIVQDPLAKSKPITLRPTEIADRKKSPTSIMPQGLLDKFTREEILDLIAYVVAKGDPKHKLFQGGHDHHK
jgi:putative heme-binding domain-containing protein